jgi:hypothetical protein
MFITKLFSAVCVLALLAPALGLTHGWDCISCKSSSMLVADFGTHRSDITLSDPWWINAIADSYAAIVVNVYDYIGTPNKGNHYNGTGEDGRVSVARALKKRNPNIKVLFYQAADRVADTEYVQAQLNAHPDWWLRDDYGNVSNDMRVLYE